MAERFDLTTLLALVARLRAPDGCPWDREQSLPDLRAYLLEEAHELAGAIDSGDWEKLEEELGDVLFQVAFIGRLAEEGGAFPLERAVETVHRKMVARHPHVFGDEVLADSEAVRQAWERRKIQKEAGKGALLAGVPAGLPALLGAYRLTQKAAGVGFDWPTAEDVLGKIREEAGELQEILAAAEQDKERAREEMGDLLFTVANLARKLDIDPEAALAAANLKFRRRFDHVEKGLGERGKTAADSTLEEMDELWEGAKKAGL